MDSYFISLDSFMDVDKNTENINKRCCDNMENYMVCEAYTKCRICDQEITILSSNPEKCFEGGKTTSRHGMATSELLPESTTGSVIQPSYTNNSNMRIISRLQVYQGIPYKTRSLLCVFNTISENCLRNNISKKIINEAQGLYKIISQYKISRGSNRIGIISGSIFISCKNCGAPRSSSEIARIMGTDKKVITKGIKNIQDIIRTNKIPLERVVLDRVTSIDLIDRICNSLNLDSDVVNDIKLLCHYFNDKYKKILSSCTPPSFAAAIINYYVLSNKLDIDKNDISKNSDVSVVTIQKITNILISNLND